MIPVYRLGIVSEVGDARGAGELPSREPAPEAAYDIRYLAGVLWRYRGLIAAVTAAGTTAVLIYLLLSLVLPEERNPLPNVYQAEALLLIPRSVSAPDFNAEVSNLLSNSSLSGLLPGQVNNMRLALTLLNSKTTVDRVADHFDLAARYNITPQVRGAVRKRFLSKATFETQFSERTLRIAYRSAEPEFAAAVVNRLVETLEHRFEELGIDRGRTKRDLIASRHREVEQRIVHYAERIKEFQQRYGVLNVDDLAREYVRRVADLNTRLLLQEVEIQTYAGVAPSNDSALLVLQAERDNLGQLIEEMESGYVEYDGQLPAQAELPDLAQEFARLRLEQAVQVELFKLLSREYELAKLEVAGQERVFQVLEWAEVPDLRSGPSRRRILMFAFAAFLATGMVAALVLNAVRNWSAR